MLLATLITASAFLAQRLTASALSQIFALDVVTSRTLGIVVVYGLQNRVPRSFLGHNCTSCCSILELTANP